MANEMAAQTRREKIQAEEVVVDLSSSKGLPWQGEASELDPDEDAWARGGYAPPVPKIYELELALQDSKLVKFNPKDEKTWSYVINIEGRITEEGEYNNFPMFLRVSTYIKKGAKTSTAYNALIKLGYRKELEGKKLSPIQIATSLAKVLAKAPKAKWENDWRASYQDTKEKWHNVCNTYDEFPDDPDTPGAKQHTFKVTAIGGRQVDVGAQNQVINWIEKGKEAVSVRESKTAALLDGDLDLEPGTAISAKATNGSGKAAPTAKKPEPVEDELTLD